MPYRTYGGLMPIIDLTAPRGSLSEETRDKLVSDLTEIALRWEGVGHGSRPTDSAWAYVHESEAGYVGGRRFEQARYRLVLTVAAGVLDDVRKGCLVAEATSRVLAAEGSIDTPANRGRVYCLIQEVRDGNWGAYGRIVRLRDVGSVLGGATTV
jgi:phenylpyruvate tautomerase PptA (4-oxalocrotonate tautomerase family)